MARNKFSVRGAGFVNRAKRPKWSIRQAMPVKQDGAPRCRPMGRAGNESSATEQHRRNQGRYGLPAAVALGAAGSARFTRMRSSGFCPPHQAVPRRPDAPTGAGLHKPVQPMKLRAMLSRFLTNSQGA
jgi:hypothetical protein